MSYLVKDAQAELERIKQEEAERMAQQLEQQTALNKMDAFGEAE